MERVQCYEPRATYMTISALVTFGSAIFISMWLGSYYISNINGESDKNILWLSFGIGIGTLLLYVFVVYAAWSNILWVAYLNCFVTFLGLAYSMFVITCVFIIRENIFSFLGFLWTDSRFDGVYQSLENDAGCCGHMSLESRCNSSSVTCYSRFKTYYESNYRQVTPVPYILLLASIASFALSFLAIHTIENQKDWVDTIDQLDGVPKNDPENPDTKSTANDLPKPENQNENESTVSPPVPEPERIPTLINPEIDPVDNLEIKPENQDPEIVPNVFPIDDDKDQFCMTDSDDEH